jgi:adenylate cyclase
MPRWPHGISSLIQFLQCYGLMPRRDGQGYASCGRKAEARRVLNQLLQMSKQSYVSPHWIASIYAGLGENDAAFEWLDKAVEKRFGPLIYLNVNPIWDNLRSDPRFKTLGQRVGLP